MPGPTTPQPDRHVAGSSALQIQFRVDFQVYMFCRSPSFHPPPQKKEEEEETKNSNNNHNSHNTNNVLFWVLFKKKHKPAPHSKRHPHGKKTLWPPSGAFCHLNADPVRGVSMVFFLTLWQRSVSSTRLHKGQMNKKGEKKVQKWTRIRLGRNVRWGLASPGAFLPT